MNAHALTYPALQRRLISDRRARAFFLPRTTQQVRRRTLFWESVRALAALLSLATWCVSLLLIAS
jgi:hypothetical protein